MIDYFDKIGGIQNVTFKNLKEYMKEYTISILTMLQKQVIANSIAQSAIAKISAPLSFGATLAALPAIFAATAPAIAAFEAAKLGIRALATGGVVTGPQLALIGEAGNEAVLPLTNQKSMQMIGQAVARNMPQNNTYYNNTDRTINVQLDGQTVMTYFDKQRDKQARKMGGSNYAFGSVY
jgi:hypothetical protein